MEQSGFPSDIAAGIALGQAVGERAVQRGQTDGSQVMWDPSTQHTGVGFRVSNPPKNLPSLEPLGGTWKLWVLEQPNEMRLAAPPDFGSARWQAEIAAVQDAVDPRSFQQESEARWRQSTSVLPLPGFGARKTDHAPGPDRAGGRVSAAPASADGV